MATRPKRTSRRSRTSRGGPAHKRRGATTYLVMAGGDVLYQGPTLREAQDRFDQAAHDNYEGARYVDEDIELQGRTGKDRRVLRWFGPKDPAPRYYHPLARWIDKGLRD